MEIVIAVVVGIVILGGLVWILMVRDRRHSQGSLTHRTLRRRPARTVPVLPATPERVPSPDLTSLFSRHQARCLVMRSAMHGRSLCGQ